MNARLAYIPLFALLAACDAQVDVHRHPELKSGKDYFDYHCAGCHGYDGEGSFLEGIPANILTSMSFSEIVNLVRFGRSHENRSMPVFKSMSEKEAVAIVKYLKKLRKEFDQAGSADGLLVKP